MEVPFSDLVPNELDELFSYWKQIPFHLDDIVSLEQKDGDKISQSIRNITILNSTWNMNISSIVQAADTMINLEPYFNKLVDYKSFQGEFQLRGGVYLDLGELDIK